MRLLQLLQSWRKLSTANALANLEKNPLDALVSMQLGRSL